MRYPSKVVCALFAAWCSTMTSFGAPPPARPEITIKALPDLDEARKKASTKLNSDFRFSDDGGSYTYVVDHGLKEKVMVWNSREGPAFDIIYSGLPAMVTENSLTRTAGGKLDARSMSTYFAPAGNGIAYVGLRGTMKYAVVQSGTSVKIEPFSHQDSSANADMLSNQWAFQSIAPDLHTMVLYRGNPASLQIDDQAIALPGMDATVAAWSISPQIFFDTSGKRYWSEVTLRGQTPPRKLIVDGKVYKDEPEGIDSLVLLEGPHRFAAVKKYRGGQGSPEDYDVLYADGAKSYPGQLICYAFSRDGSHFASVILDKTTRTSTGMKLLLDGREIAQYPVISTPAVAPDGTVAAIVSGNGKSAVIVDGQERSAGLSNIRDLSMGPHGDDLAYFSGNDIIFRDHTYHLYSGLTMARHFTSEGHLALLVGDSGRPNRDIVSTDFWVDGNCIGIVGLRSVYHPVWETDDHLVVVASDNSQHFYRIDMRLQPAPDANSQVKLLNTNGTLYDPDAQKLNIQESLPKSPSIIDR